MSQLNTSATYEVTEKKLPWQWHKENSPVQASFANAARGQLKQKIMSLRKQRNCNHVSLLPQRVFLLSASPSCARSMLACTGLFSCCHFRGKLKLRQQSTLNAGVKPDSRHPRHFANDFSCRKNKTILKKGSEIVYQLSGLPSVLLYVQRRFNIKFNSFSKSK